MTKIVARPIKVTRGGVFRSEYINPTLVNRGDWFGKTWLLVVGGHTEDVFVVEAGDSGEAIDAFVDSKYGHIIVINEEDVEDEEDQYRAGNEGLPVDLENVYVYPCEVDYGDYLISKDNNTAFTDFALAELAEPENAGFLIDVAVRHGWDEISDHFNNDWIDYVEEQNANKSDDEYNATIAGKEPKDG